MNRLLVGFVLMLLVPPAGPALADSGELSLDRLEVKGAVLEGQIEGFGPKGILLKTIYGEGVLTIPYADVERVDAGDLYRVVFDYGESEVHGRLLGVEDGEPLVGTDAADAIRVDPETIQTATLLGDYERSFLRRVRTGFEAWNFDVEFGVSVEEGAVDKVKWRIGGEVNRRIGPARYLADVSYRFEEQKPRGKPRSTTKDEFQSVGVLQYDLPRIAERLFAFGLIAVEWDKVRLIEVRTFPTLGVGYRILDREEGYVQASAGFGYVYEDFIHRGSNDYASAYVGVDGRWEFSSGTVLRGRIGYWPGLVSPGANWLFRSALDLTMPIVDPLALRFGIENTNDNNPGEDVGNNKFTTDIGVVIQF